jgi:hypothetical protein
MHAILMLLYAVGVFLVVLFTAALALVRWVIDRGRHF